MTLEEWEIVTGKTPTIPQNNKPYSRKNSVTHSGKTWRQWPGPHHHDRQWAVPTPEPTICDHTSDGSLCPDCTRLYHGLLSDIPAMITDLETTMIKDVRFRPTTQTSHTGSAPDLFNHRAAHILHQLKAFTRSAI
jgi:hypothetical protein